MSVTVNGSPPTEAQKQAMRQTFGLASLQEVSAAVANLMVYVDNQFGQINRLPIVEAALQAISDAEASLSGNLITLLNARDTDGDAVAVSAITYHGAQRQLGAAFATTYGSMTASAGGLFSFYPNALARALDVGDVAVEVFGVTVADGRGGFRTTTYSVSIMGTNNVPAVAADVGVVPHGSSWSGNVLANDSDPEGRPLSVVSYSVDGVAGQPVLGAPFTVPGFGTLTIAANGAGLFVPDAGVSPGPLPAVECWISDGVNQVRSALSLSIAPPAATPAELKAFVAALPKVATRPAPNPVVGRPAPDRSEVVTSYPGWDYSNPLPSQIGRPANALDFEVGPGKAYETPGDVPWESILPGDIVLIHYREQPYNDIITISTRARPDAWIQVIGVPDPVTGALPKWTGVNAVANPAHHYSTSLEGYGLIILFSPSGLGEAENFKPGFIHIDGINFTGVKSTNSYTKRTGGVAAWDPFQGPIYAMGVDNVTVTRCQINGNGQGIFVNSTQGERRQSRNLHLFLNFIFDNGNFGRFGEHNAYTEAIGTIYELNYFGKPADGSNGDNIKDRSAGVVFRYNYIEEGANLISLRDPESNAGHEAIQLDSRGQRLVAAAFVYANMLVTGKYPEAMIGHGDGKGGDIREGSLYFYSNVVVARANPVSGYYGGVYYDQVRMPLFAMLNTRSPATVVSRNNLLYVVAKDAGQPSPKWGLFFWQGLANWSGNWIGQFTNTAFDTAFAPNLSKGVQFNGAGLGGLTASSADPGFVNLAGGDYTLLPTSPYFSLNSPLPQFAVDRGLAPARMPVLYPFDKLPKPQVRTMPSTTGSPVQGGLLTVGGFAFSPLPDSFLYQWYRLVMSAWESISGATGPSYQSQEEDVGTHVKVGVKGHNDAGDSEEAFAPPVQIVSSSTPVNTSAPTLSGSMQVTFPVHANMGAWTNDPQRFEVIITLDGVEVDTTGTWSSAAEDVGKKVRLEVKAFNAAEEMGVAYSVEYTLLEVSLDPDANDTYNFAAPDGTNIGQLGAPTKWRGMDVADYGNSVTHFKCEGGKLRCTSDYGNWLITWVWHEDGAGDDASAEALLNYSGKADATQFGLGETLTLRSNETQKGYAFGVGINGIYVMRNGDVQYYTTDMTDIPRPAKLRVVPSGGSFAIYLEDVLVHTYVDPSPLTGGSRGVISRKDGNHAVEVTTTMEWLRLPMA